MGMKEAYDRSNFWPGGSWPNYYRHICRPGLGPVIRSFVPGLGRFRCVGQVTSQRTGHLAGVRFVGGSDGTHCRYLGMELEMDWPHRGSHGGIDPVGCCQIGLSGIASFPHAARASSLPVFVYSALLAVIRGGDLPASVVRPFL